MLILTRRVGEAVKIGDEVTVTVPGVKADQARQCLRLNLADGAALAGDAYQELTEAVIKLLDVSEDSHRQMLQVTRRGVHAVLPSA